MVPQEKARLKMASDLGFGNLTVNELFATTNATLMNYVVQQLQVGYFLRIPPNCSNGSASETAQQPLFFLERKCLSGNY